MMHSCDHCKTTILFGGVNEGGGRYCRRACADADGALRAAARVGEDVIAQRVESIRQQQCPACSGPGPVNLYTAETVMSFLVVTTWRRDPILSCAACGRRKLLKASMLSGVIGWWGFPWGLVRTPVAITRNIAAIRHARPDAPATNELVVVSRRDVGERLLAIEREAKSGAASS